MALWIVAQTITGRENVAATRIADAGFEVFAPKARMLANGTVRIVALFPSYLFVLIVDRWRVIAKTTGVLGVIMCGEKPARCPDREITKIKSMVQRDGLIRLPMPKKRPRLIVGQDVHIVSGPFRGFNAIYDGMSKHDRECVLLEILGRKTRVEIAPNNRTCVSNRNDVLGNVSCCS